MTTPVRLGQPPEIEYPDSDGQPMSDNTFQFQWIVTLQGNLDALFENDRTVFVAGDLLWYAVQGRPDIRVYALWKAARERAERDRKRARQARRRATKADFPHSPPLRRVHCPPAVNSGHYG